jgi:hypothetical protein
MIIIYKYQTQKNKHKIIYIYIYIYIYIIHIKIHFFATWLYITYRKLSYLVKESKLERSGQIKVSKEWQLWRVWKIQLKVSWCGEPLSYAARQTSTLTERWTGSPKAGRSGSTIFHGYPQMAAISTHWIVPNWHFLNTLTEVFSRLFPQL